MYWRSLRACSDNHGVGAAAHTRLREVMTACGSSNRDLSTGVQESIYTIVIVTRIMKPGLLAVQVTHVGYVEIRNGVDDREMRVGVDAALRTW